LRLCVENLRDAPVEGYALPTREVLQLWTFWWKNLWDARQKTVFVYYSVMKFSKLLFIFAVLVLSALGLTAQTEITEKQFNEIEAKGAESLKTSSHRLIRKQEYFEDRTKPGRISEIDLHEFLSPNKRRTVEEKFNNNPHRIERIWDGKFLFEKINDGEWKRYNGGTSVSSNIETGKITNSYKYLGKTDLEGKRADLYEFKMVRIARKMTMNDIFTVHYLRQIRYWFSVDGKLLMKIKEDEIEGRNELSRETTIVDYEANIKIETPITPEKKGYSGPGQWGEPTGEFVKPNSGVSSDGGQGSGRGSGNGTGIENAPVNNPSPPQPLKIISKPRAQYTEAARSTDVQGTVILRVTFLANGTIGNINVIKGLSHGLSEQAIAAARRIKFEPARLNNEPVTVTKQIEFPFILY